MTATQAPPPVRGEPDDQVQPRRADVLAPRLVLGALAMLPLVFVAVFFMVPLGGMLTRGFFPADATGAHHLDLAAVPQVLSRGRTLGVLWFTVAMATAGTVCSVALGVPVAFAVYRLRFPGRTAVRAVVMAPFVLPTVVVGVMFRSLLAPGGPAGFLGWDGHWVSILLALVFFNLAVVVRTVGTTWHGMDHRSADAAAALGATGWQVFRTVTLPALTPAIVSAATLVFLFCSTSFGVVLTLGGLRYGTIETEIYFLTTQFFDLQAAAVLSVLQIVVVLVLLGGAARARAATQSSLRRGPAAGSERPPRRGDLPVLLVSAAVVVAVVTPLASLVWRSLHDGQTFTLRYYRLLGDPDASPALRVSVTEAVANSLRTALDATVLAVVLGLMVSILVTRRPRRARERRLLAGMDALFMLPLGVSAVTVGFGFLITLDTPPLDLRSSPVLVPIAQATVALPLVVRTLTPVLSGVDARLGQAAAALGAGPLRAAWTVEAPVLARPVLAAVGFAFAVSLGEFGATSFLARPERPTVPVLIYDLISSPGADNAGMALAASVVLAVLTTTVITSVERLRSLETGGL
ncbi:MAG TPA: iron ABC transporter permease [Ornithinimicrobium sp.]|uniref:ABC transporter permease n=1 Tax=Ornithinimicrobium sp. TaxID=1977084 RepID=UPI002B46FBEE|nr:iron ABC transporter permease [Ornithinimicrobium sp.]HKJ10843.1 iron ABC transporter permease [Ornithinimicrobium sp.]